MCPPGTDQTLRSPQRWHLVLPTLKQRQKLKRVDAPIMPQFHGPVAGNMIPLNFGTKLARSQALSYDHYECKDEGLPAKSRPQNSQLLSLPNELITSIFGTLDQLSVINLGLTCEFLLNVTLEHIDQDIRKHAGLWAGEPLAIIGNYLRSLPPPFFEDGLAYESVGRKDLIETDHDNGKSFRPRRHHYLPAREFLWATKPFQKASDENTVGLPSWLETLDKSEPELPRLDTDYPQRVIMKEALLHSSITECAFSSEALFANSGYYLRNLNTRELVRLCVCDGLDRAHVRQLNNETLTAKYMLDDLMIVQTRWSDFGSAGSVSLRYFDTPFPNGSWAGHRFDIVPVKAHETQTAVIDLSQWHDVTENILIKTAWERDFSVGLQQMNIDLVSDIDVPDRTDDIDEWICYMDKTRTKLKQNAEPPLFAQEILRWTAKLEEMERKVLERPYTLNLLEMNFINGD